MQRGFHDFLAGQANPSGIGRIWIALHYNVSVISPDSSTSTYPDPLHSTANTRCELSSLSRFLSVIGRLELPSRSGNQPLHFLASFETWCLLLVLSYGAHLKVRQRIDLSRHI